ncbi:5800_t:CDS:1, partial [Ambispora leptoticha]
DNCFHCNSLDSPSHWRTCINPSLLHQLILSTTTNYLHSVELDISNNELDNLIQKIYKHEAFYNIAPQSYSFHIEPTLKGLIPRSLIQTIQDYNIPYKTASNIIINLLLKINEQLYEQVWKPYCTNFANWKKQQQLTFPYYNNSNSTQQSNDPTSDTLSLNQQSKNINRTQQLYTYSCLCELPDQLHSHTGVCPP